MGGGGGGGGDARLLCARPPVCVNEGRSGGAFRVLSAMQVLKLKYPPYIHARLVVIVMELEGVVVFWFCCVGGCFRGVVIASFVV